jgi:redox-sensitive bicupin YhaK (pirin superfamily)
VLYTSSLGELGAVVEQDANILMKRLSAGEHLSLAARTGRMVHLATVEGELIAGEQRLSVPERLVVRGGEISVASDAGATVVVVDVPLK